MADLLIRIRDKESSGDAETDALQFKRGDVVAVWPTPGPWGGAELTNPDWRILSLPNVDVADVGELLRVEADALEKTARKRRARFNVDGAGLPAPIRAWLADDTRAQPILTSNISRAAFLAFVEAKAPRVRFRVL
jgi:hypothetical protein